MRFCRHGVLVGTRSITDSWRSQCLAETTDGGNHFCFPSRSALAISPCRPEVGFEDLKRYALLVRLVVPEPAATVGSRHNDKRFDIAANSRSDRYSNSNRGEFVEVNF